MGIKRIVSTDFWTDEKVVDMFSPEDKLFMLYLLTNPHTTQLGVYPVAKKVMAFEIGYSVEAVNVLLDRFENKYGIIKYSPDTSEIAIKNYLLHSIAKGGKPVEDLLLREIKKVKNKDLLTYIFGAICDKDGLNQSVKTVMSSLNENDNDNENENEESSHDSHNDSYRDSSKSKKQKHKYGEYQHVLLTDDEYQRLKDRFPSSYETKIKVLDEGIELKGYRYKSHYLAILKWAKEDKTEESKESFAEQFRKAAKEAGWDV